MGAVYISEVPDSVDFMILGATYFVSCVSSISEVLNGEIVLRSFFYMDFWKLSVLGVNNNLSNIFSILSCASVRTS